MQRVAPAFGGAEWVYWDVLIPRQPAELRTAYRIDGLDEGPLERDHVAVPARDQAPRIAFFSCNGVSDSRDWTSQPEMEALWEKMLSRHKADVAPDGSGGAYHVLIGGGDQIYCDSVWSDVGRLARLDSWKKRQKAKVTPALLQELERHYAKLYARWKESWFAELHSRVPGLYTWDDHDIFDGWGSYSDEIQDCDLFGALFSLAQRAFVLFQLGGGASHGAPCVDPMGAHHLQAVRLGNALDIVALDLRTHRRTDLVMAEVQWQALKGYLAARAAGNHAPHLLVVSSIPVVYLNFARAETALDWIPWRQELEDDLRDQWESSEHQEERGRLVMTLLDHAAATKTRVTILSGDVHVGARGRIASRRPEHLLPGETETVVHQLTSSAIVHPPPSALQLAGMRTVAARGPAPLHAVSHVETEVVGLSADHFLLGQRNWMSIEHAVPGAASKHELWVRWISQGGEVKPPILVHRR